MKLKLTLFALLVWATTYTQTTTLNTNQIRPGANGQVLKTVAGVPTWSTGSDSITALNGLTLLNDTLKLGGILTDSTVINQGDNSLHLLSNYANFIHGLDPLGLRTSWIRKEITPTLITGVGMLDLSPFGQDSNFIQLGNFDLLGNPTTSIYIKPTSKEINISSDVNNIFSDEINFNIKEKWQGGVNDLNTGAGHLKCDFSITPYDPTPSVFLGFKKEQVHAYGFAGLESVTGGYSNIYWGRLDALNIITVVSRVQTDSLGVHLTYLDSNNNVTIYGNYIEANKYPNTRDDASVTTPTNFIYTDANGKLQSTTLGQILKAEQKDTQTGLTGTALTLPATPLTGTLKIFKNGMLLDEGGSADYTISGANVTFSVALISSDKIKSFYY